MPRKGKRGDDSDEEEVVTSPKGAEPAKGKKGGKGAADDVATVTAGVKGMKMSGKAAADSDDDGDRKSVV